MRVLAATIAALLLVACNGDDPVRDGDVTVDTLTSEELASLPSLTVSDGSLLCIADGYDDCPLSSAYANQVTEQQFVVWEPLKRILTREAGDTAFKLLGNTGTAVGQYGVVGAVRRSGARQWEIIEIGPQLVRATLDSDGAVAERDTLVLASGQVSLGFVHQHAVMQRITDWTPERGGEFTVSRLENLADTVGRVLLRSPIPWMQGTADSLLVPPLITNFPVYAVARDGGLVWSAGMQLQIERTDSRGQPQWRLHGPAGPPVLAEDLDRREADVREAARLTAFEEWDYALMRSKTDSLHPAVAVVVASPSGEVFAALTPRSAMDSVQWLRISASGNVESRFVLRPLTRVLLAAGDSLLVHRASESDPWEVRWLKLER